MAFNIKAERLGFEPRDPVKGQLLSRQLPSATRPPLLKESEIQYSLIVFEFKKNLADKMTSQYWRDYDLNSLGWEDL